MLATSFGRIFSIFCVVVWGFSLHAYTAQAATIPLTNPSAETGTFTGWTATTGGDPWTIVNGFAHTGSKSFVSSYLDGTLNVVVDLIAAGYTAEQLDAAPEVTAGVWVAGYDNGSGTDDHYDFELELQGAGHGAIITHSFGDQRTTSTWTQISRTLSGYGPGLRYIAITATGRSSAFWAGNYGAAFDDFTLTVGGGGTPPYIQSVSPTDGATNATNTSLSITFDDVVTVNTGNITVYRSDTNALVSTVDVTSGAVTGSGTSTINVRLPQTLPRNTDYYVHIDTNAFRDTSSNGYYGIATNVDWNFRTLSSSSHAEPAAAPVDNTITDLQTAVNTSTSAVTLSWTKGGDVPFSRVFVSTDGINWQAISDFLKTDSQFTWIASAAFSGKTVTFKVQSSDLATELASAVSDSVLLETSTTNTAPTDSAPTTTTPPLALPNTGRSPYSGETEPITPVEPDSYIRAEHYSTVYYIDDAMNRHPVINEQTFFTWESSFDAVVTVTDATLSVLTLDRPLLPKPGVVLVKIQSTPFVFAINTNQDGTPTLRRIPNETTAQSLYGADWADYVIDIEPTLFTQFATDAAMTASDTINKELLIKRINLGA